MSTLDFGARALAIRAAAQSPLTFRELAAANLPVTVSRIESVGHSQPGQGAATYVVDSLATAELFARHPQAVFQGEGGRYFRLLSTPEGWVTPEMLGCPPYAKGVNAQPFIQDAVNYAQALGLKGVLLTQRVYDLWCPLRPHGLHQNADVGHYIVVRENLSIAGAGKDKTLLRCLNSRGGTNDTVTQIDLTYKDDTPPYNADIYNHLVHGDAPVLLANGQPNPAADRRHYDWMGSGLVVVPNTSMEYIRLENVEFDGTRTYDPKVNNSDNSNWTHKGFRCQDVNCRTIEMRNTTFRNWSGEIYYTAGNTNIDYQYLENVTLDGSAQCAFNPGTAARLLAINLHAGNAYQNELICGRGQRYVGGRFYDVGHVSLMGGAAGGADGLSGAPSFAYPMRDQNSVAPYVHFDGLRIERANTVSLGSFMRGRLHLVDSNIELDTRYGTLKDLDLEIESTIDKYVGAMAAVSISGPTTTGVLVNPSVPGFYVEPMSQVNLRIRCTQTREAELAGRAHQTALLIFGGLLGEGCSFTIDGTASSAVYSTVPTQPAGYRWPLVVIADTFTPASPDNFGVMHYEWPRSDFSITSHPGRIGVAPQAAGVFNMTLLSPYRFRTGQRLRVYHVSNSTDRIVRLPRTGAGALLTEDRVLTRRGDYIELVMGLDGLWIEAGYACQAQLRMSGSVTHDVPSIAAGATASFTVPVSGAAIRDLVEAVSFGNVSTAGLIIRAEVTAADTVTVWVTNPPGATAPVDLPAATVRVRVSKWYS